MTSFTRRIGTITQFGGGISCVKAYIPWEFCIHYTHITYFWLTRRLPIEG